MPWLCESSTLTSITSTEHPLQEETGNPLQYSCLEIIPRTGELGGPQSMGSQRVGHD